MHHLYLMKSLLGVGKISSDCEFTSSILSKYLKKKKNNELVRRGKDNFPYRSAYPLYEKFRNFRKPSIKAMILHYKSTERPIIETIS